MKISIKVTVPKNFMKDVNFLSIIARKQRNTTVPDLLKYFHGTVDGWEHKPNFDSKQTVNTRRVAVEVGPKGVFGGSNKALNIYRLVSLGSPEHDIPLTPFRRKWLAYRKGYVSSTRPGDLISNRRSYGPTTYFARQVHHPGFEARRFDKYIAEEYKDKFVSDMQDAINEATKGAKG